MKAIKCSFLVLIALLSGCSLNDKLQDFQPAIHSALRNVATENCQSSCNVIVVNPSGGDDTQTLIDAFELAKTYGPGTTIKLQKGTYTISMIEVDDFYGSLAGAGRTNTIITNKENLPCDIAWNNNEITGLLKFINGDVAISDLRFKMKDGKPCAFSQINEDYYGKLYCILSFADWNPLHQVTGSNMNATVRNVDFIGGSNGENYGTWWPTDHNTALGLWISPDVWIPDPAKFTWGKGKYIIDNCYFEYFLDGVEPSGLGSDGYFEIKNSTFNHNLGQLYASTLWGSKIFVKNNYFTKADMLDLWIDDQWFAPGTNPPDKRTEMHITGNTFDTPENLPAVQMLDFMRQSTKDEKWAMLFDISGNLFKTKAGGLGITGTNTRDAVISCNWFKGSGSYGIQFNGDEASDTYAMNLLVSDNNFKSSEYDNADVYLGPYTTVCKVFGTTSDVVVDKGVNNLVTGKHKQNHWSLHQWTNDRFIRFSDGMGKMYRSRFH
jgi:hypothetical protein